MYPQPYRITGSGEIEGPGFHDGTFTGIVVRGNNLWVFVSNYRGEPFMIKVKAIGEVSLFNFCSGNIIGDVWFFDNDKVPEHMWQKLFREKLCDADIPIAKSRLETSHLFALDSAYGGELYVGCRGLVIYSYSEDFFKSLD